MEPSQISRDAEPDASRSKRASRRERATSWLADHAADTAFEGWRLSGRTLSKGLTKSYDIAGAAAEFQHGANVGGRVTLTRVALVGLFALGLKKDRNKVYVLLEASDGRQELIESKAKNEKAARKFASAINTASAHFQQQ